MSDSKLTYPTIDVVRSILRKLKIDGASRIDSFDQDIEYTSCRVEELESYIDLYVSQDLPNEEKRILGCYFLECLNDYVSEHNVAHPMQNKAFEVLFKDEALHSEELSYRLENRDNIEEHCWPIRKEIIKWQSI